MDDKIIVNYKDINKEVKVEPASTTTQTLPVVVSSMDQAFGDALSTVISEIAYLKKHSLNKQRPALTRDETNKLDKLVKMLVSLSREEREIEKAMKLDELTQEELQAMAADYLNQRKNEPNQTITKLKKGAAPEKKKKL